VAKRLTEKMVQRAKPRGDTMNWLYDTQVGLLLAVRPSGQKSWYFKSIYPGHTQQARRQLGTYPALSLVDARLRAAEWYSLVRQGIDPATVEAAKARAQDEERMARALADSRTFGSFAERYIRERTNRRAVVDAREIRRMLIAEWADKPLHEITPRDVRELITRLRLRAPFDARNAWTHLVGIFKAAVHEEILVAAPTASVDKKLLFKDANIAPRQRVLNDIETAAFWRAAGRLGYPYGPYFRLLLLLGVRVNELARARWTEFHPQLRKHLREAAKAKHYNWAGVPVSVKTWTIPRQRAKSDRDHVVPLADDALEIFASLPHFSGGDYVFSMREGRAPINGLSKYKKRLDARMLLTLKAAARARGEDPATITLPSYVLHDLRRCVRTGFARARIPEHVAELALGHARRGLPGIYDQHSYQTEIREALEAWAARVRELVTPPPTAPLADNVLRLRKTV
jgi:integrase